MKTHPVLSFLALAACAASFTSCNNSDRAPTGQVSFALTDSASDELDAFEVDVTGITLEKLDGSTVSVLGRTTRVDFTELETLSELIIGAGLEAGIYSGLTMTFDFSGARVWIAGQSTAATVLDKSGDPITGTVNVEVEFASAFRPEIVVGSRHLFQLDLNLDSAISVNGTDNTVTFSPVLVASFDPTNPKPVAVTGILTSVDATAGTFMVEKRASNGVAIRSFTVAIDTATVFQVDGVVTLGTAGLAALALQTIGTARVWVQGTWSADSESLSAVAVESGAGTAGNGQDWVTGHIVARDATAGADATLTVLGRSIDASSDTANFNTSHQVSVRFGQTRVLRRGAGNTLSTDALNVGQHVLIFGDLTGTSLDATGTGGTPGVARMLRTSVFGIAAGAPVNDVLTVNVVRFGLCTVSNFNFVVDGITEATPGSYTIDVTGLNTSDITTNSRIRAIGWCQPVGIVGDANFAALSLVDHTAGGKVLFCQWVPTAAGAISSVTSTAMTLDVTDAGIKVIGDGFSPVTLSNSPAPTVVPLTTLGIYLIVQDSAVELNLNFATFASSLQTRLGGGAKVFRVSGAGIFDSGTQAFSALLATVILD